MRIVAISDTHGMHRDLKLPEGDVLVHCGDITGHGEIQVVADFAAWLREQRQFGHVVVVPGNHDFCFDIAKSKYDGGARQLIEESEAHFLLDSSVVLDGVKFYGSPWVPNLNGWAFFDRGEDKYVDAPRDVDVLVTHGPPYGIRDSLQPDDVRIMHQSVLTDLRVGSKPLRRYVLRQTQLKLHVFGHIHEAYGIVMDDPIFANAASCNRDYEPVNPPLVIDI